jgi:hypothetical protein
MYFQNLQFNKKKLIFPLFEHQSFYQKQAFFRLKYFLFLFCFRLQFFNLNSRATHPQSLIYFFQVEPTINNCMILSVYSISHIQQWLDELNFMFYENILILYLFEITL